MRYKHLLSKAALAFTFLTIAGVDRTHAVELLISGDFETPGGAVGDVPGWTLSEFLTGSATAVNSAEKTGGEDGRLFLRAFSGGGPLTPVQGNFDNSNLPRGAVDGGDFLTWQRNFGRLATDPTPPLPADGDANGDMNVNATDYDAWRANFGIGQQFYSNARLTQTVPATAGQSYAFQGESEFEDYYSGLGTGSGDPVTLGDRSPFGQIPSPTRTNFKMEFLDAGGNVLASPPPLDLSTENTGFFPVLHTPIMGTAPTGTVNVRVTAEALDMAWNGATAQGEGMVGAQQSAFFNNFTLQNTANPGTDLLVNGNLNDDPADALDFWDQVEVPATRDEILRTPIAGFSNHTPGGSRGVWLSAFFGAHPNFEPDPIDGIISQMKQAVEGATYTFSGWTKFEGGYSGGVDTIDPSSTGFFANMPSPTKTEIRLDFLDVNSVVIGSSVIDVKEARRAISGTANDNIWRQHTLQAVSPPGTRFVKLTAQMLDAVFNRDVGGTLGNQSAFFDDFTLDGPLVMAIPAGSTVPEPSSLAGLTIGLLLLGRRRIGK